MKTTAAVIFVSSCVRNYWIEFSLTPSIKMPPSFYFKYVQFSLEKVLKSAVDYSFSAPTNGYCVCQKCISLASCSQVQNKHDVGDLCRMSAPTSAWERAGAWILITAVLFGVGTYPFPVQGLSPEQKSHSATISPLDRGKKTSMKWRLNSCFDNWECIKKSIP